MMRTRVYFYSVLWRFFDICAGPSKNQEIRGGFRLFSDIHAVNRTPHFHLVELSSAIEFGRCVAVLQSVEFGKSN